jgi:small subunit ribosomal protein S16
MLRLRLQRMGRRHRPFYRLNAIDQRTRREGRVIENLGHYDPLFPDTSKQVVLKKDAIRKWLDQGAQPSETVRSLLAHHGILNAGEMKAWEAEREVQRHRQEARNAQARIEAVLETLTKAKADAEVTNPVKRALNVVKQHVIDAKGTEAQKLAAEIDAHGAKAAAGGA